MYVEKEVKFKIKNSDEIKKKLEKLKAKCEGSSFQRTIRFENNGKLKEQGLFLRVRSGFKNTITLKSKIKGASEHIYQREEIELEISDIEKMREIIKRIGFNDEMIMEKYRTKYKINDCEVVIDKLPFGDYIEIEGEEEKIFDLINTLKLDKNKLINKTYWDLFEDYKINNNMQHLGQNIIFKDKINEVEH
jgi:adenylate cyclase, class 2